MSDDPMYVLVRWRGAFDVEPTDVVVMGVYETLADVETRIKSIERANPQYPTVKLGPTFWRCETGEDEGFFGNRPIMFEAKPVPRRHVLTQEFHTPRGRHRNENAE